MERGRLIPASQYDAERLDSYRIGSTVNVRFTSDRMRPLERKYRAILGKVIKECQTPWKNAEAAHQAIKLACGFVNYGKTHSGDFFQWPRSLVDLDDKEMEDFFELAMGVIQDVTGIDPETLKRETAHVAEEDHDPETGELLPSDTGDGSSPSAGTDDATATASSHEPDQPSSSLADGSTEPAGTTPPSQPAGPPSLIPEETLTTVERALLIECCAKFMDLTVRPDLDPAGRRAALEAAKNAWKSEIKEHLHPKMASMFLSADSIIRGKAVRDHAIAEYADWLGCRPEEIGG